ncbi:MAG: hypothetical protein ABIS36_15510 [Chryseolinea sp.]
MDKEILVTTRWEYYVANVVGFIAVLGLFIWFCMLAISDRGIDFLSVFFWLALLMLIAIPYSMISFFSSMNTVEVTATGLIITYVFQKHKNVIQFSEIVKMKSTGTDRETVVRPRSIRESFTISLADERVFEFDRSQFNRYDQLKTICWSRLKGLR